MSPSFLLLSVCLCKLNQPVLAPSLYQRTQRSESEADNLHLCVPGVIDWQTASGEAIMVSDELTLQPRGFFFVVFLFTFIVWHRPAVPLSLNNKKLHTARPFLIPNHTRRREHKSLFWNRHQIYCLISRSEIQSQDCQAKVESRETIEKSSGRSRSDAFCFCHFILGSYWLHCVPINFILKHIQNKPARIKSLPQNFDFIKFSQSRF